MEYQTILYEVKNQIAFVTLNRPESMNAINRQMTRDLVEACRQIEEDSGIRVGIFTGAGEGEALAGMDLKERAETAFSPIERRNQKLTQTVHTLVARHRGYDEAHHRGDQGLLRGWRSGDGASVAICALRRKTPSWDSRKCGVD